MDRAARCRWRHSTRPDCRRQTCPHPEECKVASVAVTAASPKLEGMRMPTRTRMLRTRAGHTTGTNPMRHNSNTTGRSPCSLQQSRRMYHCRMKP
eukprot:2310695-Prymnesium_polylepis.1